MDVEHDLRRSSLLAVRDHVMRGQNGRKGTDFLQHDFVRNHKQNPSNSAANYTIRGDFLAVESGRVLRRPIGGWNARLWRREVALWLAWAAVVVGSWAALNIAVELVGVVSAAVA